MRKLGITLLVIVVLVVLAALVAPRFIDVNRYHDQIQGQLEKKLGRPVSLGRMSLSLIHPSFQVENAVIGEDKNFDTGRPFAEAEKLAVSVKLWPLLHKQIEINSVELVHPRIELVRNDQGTWNFATLGHPAETETAQKPAAPQRPAPPRAAPSATPAQPGAENKPAAEQFALSNLIITDGQLAFTDRQKHQSRSVYDHIDASVSDLAPDHPFSLKVTAHLPGKGKQALHLEGKGGPIHQADLMNTPFDGDVRLDQVSLSAAQKFLNSPALAGTEAQISGRAKVKTAGTKLASNGTIRLDDPIIRDVKVGYPITLDYDVADDLSSDVIQIHRGELKLGATPVTLAGTLNTRPNPAQVDVKITAANASIAEAARLASAFGVAFGKSVDVNGQVNMDVQARGPANKPQVNGQVSARNLVITGKQLPQPVKVDAVQLALTPDMVRSNDFTATSGSTSVTGNVAIANYAAPNSTLTAALRVPRARISELLNMAKAAGVSAADNISGDGALTLDIHAQGPTKNVSAMTFSGTGKIQNASLKVPNLNKPLQIHNSDITFSRNGATLQNTALSLGQSNVTGTVSIENFAAPQTQFTLNVDARIAELLNIAKAAGVSTADNISGDGALALNVHGQGPAKDVSAMIFSGTGKIQNASLTVPNLNKPVQVHNSDITFSRNGATLQNTALSLGQSNVTGTVSVKNFAAPQTQFTLNVDKVNVQELRQTFNTAPAPQKRAAVQSDRWSLIPRAEAQNAGNQPTRPGLLYNSTGAGTITIGTVQDNDLLLNNMHANVKIDHGLIEMNPLTADLYDGKEAGSLVIDLRSTQPFYTANLKLERLDADKLLSSVSNLKHTLTGQLNANVNGGFSAPSANEIARNLNGTTVLNLTNGKLMNVDLLHELAAVGKFLGNAIPAAKGFTDIVQLSGTFNIKNGVAQTNDLKATVPGGTLAGIGAVNLGDQTLNMHVTAVLNKDLSQQVGGTQIGGFMNTALANNQGELVVPVVVSGNLQHPQISPDVQQIAQMKIQNLLPSTKNPGQLTNGILKQVLGGSNQGQPAGNQGQPGGGNGQQEGIGKGITDILRGQQPQQQQSNQPAAEPNQGAGPNQKPQPSPNQNQNPVNSILDQVMGNKKQQSQPTPTPQQ
jgi:uncharacterized protein involved in outer membrane biogenesis